MSRPCSSQSPWRGRFSKDRRIAGLGRGIGCGISLFPALKGSGYRAGQRREERCSIAFRTRMDFPAPQASAGGARLGARRGEGCRDPLRMKTCPTEPRRTEPSGMHPLRMNASPFPCF